MYYLELFINIVLANPVFKMSSVVETFLKEVDYPSFVLYKKLKVAPPEKLSDFYAPEGEIKIDTT